MPVLLSPGGTSTLQPAGDKVPSFLQEVVEILLTTAKEKLAMLSDLNGTASCLVNFLLSLLIAQWIDSKWIHGGDSSTKMPPL